MTLSSVKALRRVQRLQLLTVAWMSIEALVQERGKRTQHFFLHMANSKAAIGNTTLAIFASRQVRATPAERARTLPGDDLIRNHDSSASS
jgi:hypothetical protein